MNQVISTDVLKTQGTAAHPVPMERMSAPPPAHRSESERMLDMIESIARDPTIDIERIKALMAIKERIDDREDARAAAERERLFNVAMVECQKELPVVSPNRKNDHTRSAYSDLEAIGRAVDGIIGKHGFAQSFSTAESPKPDHYRLVCRTLHVGGHTQIDTMDVPSDESGAKGGANKTAVQGMKSSQTYGRRMLMLQVFNVKTSSVFPDNDGNRAVNAPLISKEQEASLFELLESHEDVTRFLKFAKLEKMSDMLASKYDEAIARIKQRATLKEGAV